jgi:hypothetical protein
LLFSVAEFCRLARMCSAARGRPLTFVLITDRNSEPRRTPTAQAR